MHHFKQLQGIIALCNRPVRSKLNTSSLICLFIVMLVSANGVHAQAPVVIAQPAQVKSFPLSAEALGNARANEAIEVRAEITAALKSIYFTEGQRVEKGTILAELENAQQLAELAAARAALVESSSQLKRSEELFKTNVVAA